MPKAGFGEQKKNVEESGRIFNSQLEDDIV